jgi:hypothetical protein
MLCPVKLAVYFRKQSGTAKVFRLCMTKGFFYFPAANTIDSGWGGAAA